MTTDPISFRVLYRVQLTEPQRSAFELYVLGRADDLDTPEQQREARIMALGYAAARSCSGEDIDVAIDMVSEASESATIERDVKAARSLDAVYAKLCRARRKMGAV